MSGSGGWLAIKLQERTIIFFLLLHSQDLGGYDGKYFFLLELTNYMHYFLNKLIPPRPTFAQDMTEVEGKVMQEHVAYWQGLANRKIAIIFGPVLDPSGVYGIAIIETDDESVVENIFRNDPAIKAQIGFRSEHHPISDPILRQ
jgi:uncharacterized protein YciI